jgi:hypothetical protein
VFVEVSYREDIVSTCLTYTGLHDTKKLEIPNDEEEVKHARNSGGKKKRKSGEKKRKEKRKEI